MEKIFFYMKINLTCLLKQHTSNGEISSNNSKFLEYSELEQNSDWRDGICSKDIKGTTYKEKFSKPSNGSISIYLEYLRVAW